MDSFTLYSPHSPEVCAKKLRPSPLPLHGLLGRSCAETQAPPVSGSVSHTAISLRKRLSYQNSFQTFLKARLYPEGDGTRIIGSLGMHSFVKIFLVLWIGSVLALMVAVPFFSQARSSDSPALNWIVPPLMLAGAIAMVLFGRYLARHEAAFLKKFVLTQLDATEDSPAGPGEKTAAPTPR